jgi:hypothetical protein
VDPGKVPLHVLLGSHGDAGSDETGEGRWGTGGPVDPTVVDAIRRIVEKWPPPEAPVRGRSLADVLEAATVTPRERVAAAVRASVRRALLGSAVAGRRRSVDQLGPAPAVVPLPDPRDRRAGVARTVGATPLLYASTLVHRKGRGDGATHVYLDVSGSMDPWLEDLYGALTSLRAHLHPEVHLFSTEVESVPLRGLLEGARPTTYGTDVACVLEHALERRAQRVLLVTDGYVGEPADNLVRKARRRGLEIRVLLTPDGWRRDLEPHAARIEELPPLEKGDHS